MLQATKLFRAALVQREPKLKPAAREVKKGSICGYL
jgi:hypothetical protein